MRAVALAPALPLPPAAEQIDAAAIERLARGEIAALGEIYQRHHGDVFRYVARATGNSGEVDDIVHNTFLTVPSAARRYDGSAPCRAWILGIASRLIHRRNRSLGRLARMLLRLHQEPAPVAPSSQSPERSALVREDLSELGRALMCLTHDKRTVLLMAEVEGLPCDDIAAALEIPVGTVWTRLHHARAEIRERLRKRNLR